MLILVKVVDQYKIQQFFSCIACKVNEEIITFDDIEIKNINFTININNADIDKIIPKKVSRSKKGFKYFIGYKEDGKV